jgi:hypothetical protein
MNNENENLEDFKEEIKTELNTINIVIILIGNVIWLISILM